MEAFRLPSGRCKAIYDRHTTLGAPRATRSQPRLLNDDGFTGTPNLAFYSPSGTWNVENHGVPPDVEVEMDPKLERRGHDPQLEKAVEVVMDLLKKNPLPARHRPPYPNYHKDGK